MFTGYTKKDGEKNKERRRSIFLFSLLMPDKAIYVRNAVHLWLFNTLFPLD